jgi:hypothetical protein
MMAKLLAGIACSVFVLACGGSSSNVPADNCSNFAGTYSVTTEIVSTTCNLGLHAITPATLTVVQTAPSCSFTMTNSLYPSSQYAGYFTMQGNQATVTWTSVNPAPTVAGYSLTYKAENLTITPAVAPAAATISGSFDWHSGAGCDGTTNVCHGSVANCLTPN